MGLQSFEAFLLGVDFISRSGKTGVRLFLKDANLVKAFPAYDLSFQPYFLFSPDEKKAGAWKSEKLEKFVESLCQFEAALPKPGVFARVEKAVEVEKNYGECKKRLLKIFCSHPVVVPKLAKRLRDFGEVFEYDIPFHFRYILDKGISPNSLVRIEAEKKNSKKGEFLQVVSIEPAEAKASAGAGAKGKASFRVLSLDIETYNPSGELSARRDPCIMMSFADEKGSHVLTHTKKVNLPFVRSFSSEKEMLEAFCEEVRQRHADIICTYNGDSFDLPYLKERALRTKADFRLGRDRNPVRVKKLAMRFKSSLGGRIHFDVYTAISFLSIVGAIKLPRLTLGEAYKGLLSGTKVAFDHEDIWTAWETGKQLETLAEYSRVDAVACFDLAKYALPMQIELSSFTGMPLFDSSRASTGQLVEFLLLKDNAKTGDLVPNKPSGSQVYARQANPIQGAFVKMPLPGVYEDIAVLDFRSLYPSIIIAHNIDPSTLNCKCCEGKKAFLSPQGHRFCAKKKGLMPKVLEGVLDKRVEAKAEMKKAKKQSPEYVQLDARQFALKVLANSFYGYTVYARSRWYSRECGESITAFARQYILDTIDKAEKAGFNVLYSDTDSIFLIYEKGGEKKVLEFQENINKHLPGRMELELEDFYPRGIFVGKKAQAKAGVAAAEKGEKAEKTGKSVNGEQAEGGQAGAKKKYALINKEGKIKIRGFELVRRDWSAIARNTQKKMLYILLEEGDVEKAVGLVRETIQRLQSGKVPLEEVSIMTQLQKKTSSYEIKSPEVSAALKAREAGLKVPEGAILQFVITKQGKSISEKAQVLSLAKDYDADYYVNNQIIPSVLKILGAFGVDAEQLKTGKTQSTLGGWQ